MTSKGVGWDETRSKHDLTFSKQEIKIEFYALCLLIDLTACGTTNMGQICYQACHQILRDKSPEF